MCARWCAEGDVGAPSSVVPSIKRDTVAISIRAPVDGAPKGKLPSIFATPGIQDFPRRCMDGGEVQAGSASARLPCYGSGQSGARGSAEAQPFGCRTVRTTLSRSRVLPSSGCRASALGALRSQPAFVRLSATTLSVGATSPTFGFRRSVHLHTAASSRPADFRASQQQSYMVTYGHELTLRCCSGRIAYGHSARWSPIAPNRRFCR